MEEEEDKQFSQRLEFFTQVQTAFSRRAAAAERVGRVVGDDDLCCVAPGVSRNLDL